MIVVMETTLNIDDNKSCEIILLLFYSPNYWFFWHLGDFGDPESAGRDLKTDNLLNILSFVSWFMDLVIYLESRSTHSYWINAYIVQFIHF